MVLSGPGVLRLPSSVLVRCKDVGLRCHCARLVHWRVQGLAQLTYGHDLEHRLLRKRGEGQRLLRCVAASLHFQESLLRGLKAQQNTVVPDEFVNPNLSPFASTAQRLKGLLTDADIWAEVKTWVVFSDLHLSRRTADICLEVLQTVHAEASARNAGIIFLGDFWHTRGALPVELLNLAVSELQTWSCPTIFIPGNHDQVNHGGEIHALSVLEATNYFIKVISEPTQYLGALWLPFRREPDVIKDAVASHSDTRVIFAHLDVVGAYMNEQRQASDGIDPSIFPSHLSVFTGHYHKPHVVKGSQVEYVGSPYQVSASETGQAKRLLLLNHQWEKVGEIPIDIGPRHYVYENEMLDTDAIQSLRKGDRVRWLVPTETLSNASKKLLTKLKREGVHIDIVFPSIAPRPRIENAEDLNAFELFRLFAKSVNMSTGATKMAIEILHSLPLPANAIQRPQVSLVLKSVELEGFGPFLDPVTYPLAQRGIRVVSGRNSDSYGADSNGAGKTTLVMAPLWAITGSTDPRPDSAKGLTSSDVVHYKAKRARVQVEGTVNEKPFIIERTTGSRKSLRFILDEEDQTCQEIKMTQERIDASLNTTLLHRAVFHGQYGVGGLLEANDKTFKEELSRVVLMEIWFAAKEKSSTDLRQVRDQVENMGGAAAQLSEQNMQLSDQVKLSYQRVHDWEQSQTRKLSRMESELLLAQVELRRASAECTRCLQMVQDSAREWDSFAISLEQLLVSDSVPPQELSGTSLSIRSEERDSLVRQQAEIDVEYKLALDAVSQRANTLKKFQESTSNTLFCDHCHQDISESHISEHVSRLSKDITALRQRIVNLEAARLEKAQKILSLTAATMEESRQQESARAWQKEKSNKVLARVNRTWEAVASAKVCVEEACSFISRELKDVSPELHSQSADTDRRESQNQALAFDDSLEPKLEQLRQLVVELNGKVADARVCTRRLQDVQRTLDVARTEKNLYAAEYKSLSEYQSRVDRELQEKVASLEQAKQSALWLKEIDAAFGHSGIQSYVLESALAELQERTARFAHAFSGGALDLLLKPTRERKSTKTSVESIEKIAAVRLADGTTEERALRQLSGGERRRLALALALGYAELAAERGGLHCDLLVLDEVLQHLDGEGKARVISALRDLPQGTVLIVCQAYSDIAQSFDLVDVVVKQDDAASLELG